MADETSYQPRPLFDRGISKSNPRGKPEESPRLLVLGQRQPRGGHPRSLFDSGSQSVPTRESFWTTGTYFTKYSRPTNAFLSLATGVTDEWGHRVGGGEYDVDGAGTTDAGGLDGGGSFGGGGGDFDDGDSGFDGDYEGFNR